ncbi:MAG: hypothetical protein B6I25_04435 [Planctomycetales bacterium 4572_13]|nr:MAG: hypothetical protein B6I25_04435 [Planctomycetales bacterium 4572_13]
MKNLPYFLGFVCMAVAYSASTTEIETLRSHVQDSRTELTVSEQGVISKFWRASLDQMLLTDSSRECVEIRKQLAEEKGSEYLSHYAATYIAEAKNAIETAFVDAQRIEGIEQRQMLERNLMILTAELKSPGLSSLALQRLDAEDAVTRYWAFKAVTSPAVIEQLTSDITGDEKTTEAILSGFKKHISVEPQAEIQKRVVRFCMAFDDPLARDILVLIADRRIKAYRDWTVSDEMLDITVLTALGNVAMLRQEPADKTLFGRKFAELYALIIQRYLKGKDALSKDQRTRLLTVIAEVDQTALGKTMGIKTGIFTSLKRRAGMEREYEVLFGDRMRSGLLAEKFKFDYGKDASGKPVTAPPELGPIPEKISSQD